MAIWSGDSWSTWKMRLASHSCGMFAPTTGRAAAAAAAAAALAEEDGGRGAAAAAAAEALCMEEFAAGAATVEAVVEEAPFGMLFAWEMTSRSTTPISSRACAAATASFGFSLRMAAASA
ncbi:hypothetical protein PMKS-003670 [Pichia membranifaciens]|uniref:Uncharacterized protein n=1 Tax=Pichia membranifaciens TaxID=4926 RepID=A0A1Q2YKU8_9ASCO|nr:hypothetical protein PMKS-003670 [Pichia membranifaciens]